MDKISEPRPKLVEALQAEITELKEAVVTARAHVYRQQGHGKHEQDRADAVAWIKRYGTWSAKMAAAIRQGD